FTWTVTSGQMPPGLRLESATGHIYGRARLKGNWTFTLEARDSQNAAAARQFTISTRFHL
ncbi:MAG TPA: Ig domain-containing protein, partial [Pyrinomonadaceae bacterium]|nr:Ig domain-containing protein [Pyrinomonadaceae bacterium]